MNSKLAATFVALGFASVAFAQQPGQQSPSQSPRQSAPEQRSPSSQPPSQSPGSRSQGSQAPGSSSQQMSFENVDKNKDGKISREEAAMVPGLNFAEADADDNDSLDQREYTLVIARLQPTPRG